jgi:SAM-dependent methyltransferase
MPDAIFAEPRLAAVYDTFNPPEEDRAFYLRLAGAVPKRILDLGCGTGWLCCALAERGHDVTGLDPAAAMLAVARRRPGSERVRWVEADARSFAFPERFDLIVMTGHVFQVFLEDADVQSVLQAARRHLAPGGRLAFETRNPHVREWEAWNPAASRERATIDGIGNVEVHYRVVEVAGDRVTFETHHRFLATGETAVSPSTLRFMQREELADHLTRAGFATVAWHGWWDGAPFTPESREIIVVAG